MTKMMTAKEFDALPEKQAILLTIVEVFGAISTLRIAGRQISVSSAKSLAAKGLIDLTIGRGGWTAFKK